MEKYFTMEDGSLCNVIEHTKQQLGSRDGLKVYIGTDSQVKKKIITFATVIVYRYGTNGAHYVYQLEEVPKRSMNIKEPFERLLEEGSKTIKLAEMLKEEIPAMSIEALQFDYNGIKKTKSQPVINVLKGWALGLGFNPQFKAGKDYVMIATKAGDHICRKKSKAEEEQK